MTPPYIGGTVNNNLSGRCVKPINTKIIGILNHSYSACLSQESLQIYFASTVRRVFTFTGLAM